MIGGFKKELYLLSISSVPPGLTVYRGWLASCNARPSFCHLIRGCSPSGLEAWHGNVAILFNGKVWLAGPIWTIGGGRSATEVTYINSHRVTIHILCTILTKKHQPAKKLLRCSNRRHLKPNTLENRHLHVELLVFWEFLGHSHACDRKPCRETLTVENLLCSRTRSAEGFR